MVARLKLKEIDGRAPPGVNAVALPLKAAGRPVWWASLAAWPNVLVALVGGDTLKLAGNS
jgi:hypothetical protein